MLSFGFHHVIPEVFSGQKIENSRKKESVNQVNEMDKVTVGTSNRLFSLWKLHSCGPTHFLEGKSVSFSAKVDVLI